MIYLHQMLVIFFNGMLKKLNKKLLKKRKAFHNIYTKASNDKPEDRMQTFSRAVSRNTLIRFIQNQNMQNKAVLNSVGHVLMQNSLLN